MSDDVKKEEAPAQEEAAVEKSEEPTEAQAPKELTDIKLNGMFASKVGMSSVFDENGKQIPVTVLKLKKWNVTQLKSKEKDGYAAVQISLLEKAEKNTGKSEMGHLKKSGASKKGASLVREIRQDLPERAKLGLEVSWDSLQKGDQVRLTATSKGRGFAGVMKRWNFAGGPAAHGSTFHRQPGSIGNCTFPGRVMAGRKMPGHYGDAKITVKNVEVVDVQKDNGVLLVKGPVPGARNGLVQLLKQSV